MKLVLSQILLIGSAIVESSLTCDNGVATYTYVDDRETYLASAGVNIDGCTDAGISVVTTGSPGDWTHIFTIQPECMNDSGTAELNITFSLLEDTDVIVDKATSTLVCGPQSYSVKYSFGEVSLDASDTETIDMAKDVAFSITRMDETYGNEVVDNDIKVGQTIYFSVKANNDSIEFDVGSCVLSGDGQSFTFIDMYDSSVCAVQAFQTDITKKIEDHTQEYQFSFGMFRFADTSESQYELECSVYVCDHDDDSSTFCANTSGVAKACPLEIDETTVSPLEQTLNGNVYYSIIPEYLGCNQTWEDATALCSQYGGFLPQPTSFDEMAKVRTGLDNEICYGDQKFYHSSINDRVDEHMYRYEDGTLFNDFSVSKHEFWAPTNPNNSGGNEDCTFVAIAHRYQHPKEMLYDSPCASTDIPTMTICGFVNGTVPTW